ncbi:MAG: transcription termination/antitermination NusG family protein [Rhodomicrobium sp.]
MQSVHRDAPEAARWIVAATHPHRESFALANLARQGFTAYCPMVTKHIRHARRAYDAPRPMFPGYVFVKYQAGLHQSRLILSTYGVRSLVRYGEAPASLPEGFVENMKARESSGVIATSGSTFEPGQEVAVTGGPFDGLIGRIAGIEERGRVLVLLDLLNQQAKVRLLARGLQPV